MDQLLLSGLPLSFISLHNIRGVTNHRYFSMQLINVHTIHLSELLTYLLTISFSAFT